LYGAYADIDDADPRIHTNNLAIEWLVDTGLVGFAAFLWMTWRLARVAWSGVRHSGPDGRAIIWQAAVTASLIAWFAHGAVDFFYGFTSTYVGFAMLCGLVLAGRSHGHQEEE
jgi:O-antigen ligase